MESNIYDSIDIDSKHHELIVFSDIHSDIKRFLELLYASNLILSYDNPMSVQWNPNATNKIIIMCGDFLDGKRPNHTNEILYENNELLLHQIILSLRNQSKLYNSYLLATLGNHDYFAFYSLDEPYRLTYQDYIDPNSKQYYLDFYNDKIKSNHMINDLNKTKSNHMINDLNKTKSNHMINDMDKIYIARAHLLAPFYQKGFHFFLKVNQCLFAHAGFGLNQSNVSLFEDPNNSIIKTHYSLLKKFANLKLIQKTSYNSFHDLFTSFIKKIPTNKTYYNLFVDSFLLTRSLQKNCNDVSFLLKYYKCKLLCVGHCPTCIGPSVFNESEIADISNTCENAHIVYSCSNHLISVDIALSSGMSPTKEFIETFHIDSKHKKAFIKRYDYQTKKLIKTYNEISI